MSVPQGHGSTKTTVSGAWGFIVCWLSKLLFGGFFLAVFTGVLCLSTRCARCASSCWEICWHHFTFWPCCLTTVFRRVFMGLAGVILCFACGTSVCAALIRQLICCFACNTQSLTLLTRMPLWSRHSCPAVWHISCVGCWLQLLQCSMQCIIYWHTSIIHQLLNFGVCMQCPHISCRACAGQYQVACCLQVIAACDTRMLLSAFAFCCRYGDPSTGSPLCTSSGQMKKQSAVHSLFCWYVKKGVACMQVLLAAPVGCELLLFSTYRCGLQLKQPFQLWQAAISNFGRQLLCYLSPKQSTGEGGACTC